jgi:photosystem II stability/assembly factor-like uncharacterized protein
MKSLSISVSLSILLFPLLVFGGHNHSTISSESGWVQGQGIYGFGPTGFGFSGNNIVAGTSCALCSQTYIFLSTDSGLTWNLRGTFNVLNHPPNTHLYSTPYVTFIKDSIFLFAGFGQVGGYTLYVSTDDGVTWTDPDTDFTQTVNCFAAIGSTVFAGTDSSIFLTTDWGKSWGPASGAATYLPVDGLATLGSILFASTPGEGIYRSTDGGKNWKEINTTNSDFGGLATIGSILFAGSASDTSIGGGLLMSMDSGVTWVRDVSLPGRAIYVLSGNNTNVFASTDTAVFVSIDSGATWKDVTGGTQVGGVAALATNGEYLFAGTGNTAWRYPLSQLTGIQQNPYKTPDGFALHQNYPNPFNPTTAISYILPAPSHVTLRVYDILGRQVTTLVNNEDQLKGTHTLYWNATDQMEEGVSSGVYFYRLTTDYGTDTKKALYLK